MIFPAGRSATLRERALELVLARVLRALSDASMETEFLHQELATARKHVLRRIAWRKRAKRASVTDGRRAG